jgi:hypothetical protein
LLPKTLDGSLCLSGTSFEHQSAPTLHEEISCATFAAVLYPELDGVLSASANAAEDLGKNAILTVLRVDFVQNASAMPDSNVSSIAIDDKSSPHMEMFYQVGDGR